MVMELNELVTNLQAEKARLAEQYRVRSLGVFGSYARGEAGPESDLDVLVEFDEPPSLFEYCLLYTSRCV